MRTHKPELEEEEDELDEDELLDEEELDDEELELLDDDGLLEELDDELLDEELELLLDGRLDDEDDELTGGCELLDEELGGGPLEEEELGGGGLLDEELLLLKDERLLELEEELKRSEDELLDDEDIAVPAYSTRSVGSTNAIKKSCRLYISPRPTQDQLKNSSSLSSLGALCTRIRPFRDTPLVASQQISSMIARLNRDLLVSKPPGQDWEGSTLFRVCWQLTL